MIKEIGEGVWAFCSYLFVPQWGKHRVLGSGLMVQGHLNNIYGY